MPDFPGTIREKILEILDELHLPTIIELGTALQGYDDYYIVI